MRKVFVLSFLIVLLAVVSFAAEGKQVSYKSGDENVTATLFTPANANAKAPALIVVHEWWGLVDWVKEQASKLADQGYVTLAVDLYHGKVAKSPDEAHELMRGIAPDRASRDLKAAFDYLAAQPNVNKDKIGAIGWCMGGGYALEAALVNPQLAATVINYGHLSSDPDALKKMNAAVLGIFGAQDRGIPVSDVRKFEQTLKSAGKQVEIVIYPDAGHGFQNPNNKQGYRAKDTADAWKRTVGFLGKNLKGTPAGD